MGITFPTNDPGLLAWSLNFTTKLNLDPVQYGTTLVRAAAYQTVHDDFAAKLALVDPSTRNKVAVIEKNDARNVLKTQAKALASTIDGTLTVTDAMKADLGLTIRSMPTSIPAPAFSPVVDVKDVNGHTVRILVHGPDSLRRALPEGCEGMAVFSHVGEVCPTDPSLFKFEGNTTRCVMDITFPDSVAPGATVWITAMYFNERKQSGPGSTPVSTKIQFGGMSMAA